MTGLRAAGAGLRAARTSVPRIAGVLVAVAVLVVLGCESEPEKPARVPEAPTGRFADNGDGSVTDLTTGLVWEQKCNCPESLHHYQARYRWAADGEHETIWDWIEKVNAEEGEGFAGHDDWRVPNVKELMSLVDYGRGDPAVAPELHQCVEECDDPVAPQCACAGSAPHWSSTTFSDFPANALIVGFTNGNIDDYIKMGRSMVRAVRGPVALPARAGAPASAAQSDAGAAAVRAASGSAAAGGSTSAR